MDPLQAYAAFVRTFEVGSFSAVAREMGATQSAISKQIASLEESLGVQLFARTTRRVQPTSEALQLYDSARQLLDAVRQLKTPGDRQDTVSGTLRLTAPSAYGRFALCPLLPRFRALHPEVRLEVLLTDQVVDLVEEGMELAVRIGALSASTLMARPLAPIEHLLVATPQFLRRHPAPHSPADLQDLPCVLSAGGPRIGRWEFESEHGRQAVEVGGVIRVNDPEAMFEMVCAHVGIALVPAYVVGDAIADGTVQWLLQDFYPMPSPVSIVYPQTRFPTKRARAFIDFLLAEQQDSSAARPEA